MDRKKKKKDRIQGPRENSDPPHTIVPVVPSLLLLATGAVVARSCLRDSILSFWLQFFFFFSFRTISDEIGRIYPFRSSVVANQWYPCLFWSAPYRTWEFVVVRG